MNASAEDGRGWAQSYGFTGKEEDVQVGLVYFGKRYLSPQLGRWLSADPLAIHAPGRADFNLYAYVSGAVLGAVDPVGLEAAQREQGSDMPGNTPDANHPYVSRSEPTPAPMNASTGAHGNGARGESTSATSAPNACEEMSPEASNTEGKSGGKGGPNIKAGLVGAPKPGPLTGANGTTTGTGGPDTRAYEQWRAEADQGRLGGGVHGSGSNTTSMPARAHAGNLDAAAGVASALVGAGAALRLTLPSVGGGLGFSRAAEGGLTTVYRVEGTVNQRLAIDAAGNVSIGGQNMLFLNFGDAARAEQFLTTRVAQGMEGATMKSFQVQTSFFNELKASGVPESMARQFPNSPLIVDATKAANQFGLRPPQIEALKSAIVPRSGR